MLFSRFCSFSPSLYNICSFSFLSLSLSHTFLFVYLFVCLCCYCNFHIYKCYTWRRKKRILLILCNITTTTTTTCILVVVIVVVVVVVAQLFGKKRRAREKPTCDVWLFPFIIMFSTISSFACCFLVTHFCWFTFATLHDFFYDLLSIIVVVVVVEL